MRFSSTVYWALGSDITKTNIAICECGILSCLLRIIQAMEEVIFMNGTMQNVTLTMGYGA